MVPLSPYCYSYNVPSPVLASWAHSLMLSAPRLSVPTHIRVAKAIHTKVQDSQLVLTCSVPLTLGVHPCHRAVYSSYNSGLQLEISGLSSFHTLCPLSSTHSLYYMNTSSTHDINTGGLFSKREANTCLKSSLYHAIMTTEPPIGREANWDCDTSKCWCNKVFLLFLFIYGSLLSAFLDYLF